MSLNSSKKQSIQPKSYLMAARAGATPTATVTDSDFITGGTNPFESLNADDAPLLSDSPPSFCAKLPTSQSTPGGIAKYRIADSNSVESSISEEMEEEVNDFATMIAKSLSNQTNSIEPTTNKRREKSPPPPKDDHLHGLLDASRSDFDETRSADLVFDPANFAKVGGKSFGEIDEQLSKNRPRSVSKPENPSRDYDNVGLSTFTFSDQHQIKEVSLGAVGGCCFEDQLKKGQHLTWSGGDRQKNEGGFPASVQRRVAQNVRRAVEGLEGDDGERGRSGSRSPGNTTSPDGSYGGGSSYGKHQCPWNTHDTFDTENVDPSAVGNAKFGEIFQGGIYRSCSVKIPPVLESIPSVAGRQSSYLLPKTSSLPKTNSSLPKTVSNGFGGEAINPLELDKQITAGLQTQRSVLLHQRSVLEKQRSVLQQQTSVSLCLNTGSVGGVNNVATTSNPVNTTIPNPVNSTGATNPTATTNPQPTPLLPSNQPVGASLDAAPLLEQLFSNIGSLAQQNTANGIVPGISSSNVNAQPPNPNPNGTYMNPYPPNAGSYSHQHWNGHGHNQQWDHHPSHHESGWWSHAHQAYTQSHYESWDPNATGQSVHSTHSNNSGNGSYNSGHGTNSPKHEDSWGKNSQRKMKVSVSDMAREARMAKDPRGVILKMRAREAGVMAPPVRIKKESPVASKEESGSSE